MITHKAIRAGFVGSDWQYSKQIIGCYECFDSANRAALEYVRSATEPGCSRSASVVTVDHVCVVSYHGNARELTADTGPDDMELRKMMGWDLPLPPTERSALLGVFATRRERIQAIDRQAAALQTTLNLMHAQRRELELEEVREAHPCDCVKLNASIGIHDTGEQARQGREGLSFGGWVSETLSALKDCPRCHGTGVPEDKE